VTVHGTPTAEGRSGVVSFSIADVHPHDVATSLDAAGVCVRAGHHCAQPLMERLGIPGTVRASFSIYNTQDDVTRLFEGIHKAQRLFA
jgi:cysteine desulfurase/selenocysteine lyase